MSDDENEHDELEDIDVCCPFCHEEEFDLVGLKWHLLRGNCKAFNETHDL